LEVLKKYPLLIFFSLIISACSQNGNPTPKEILSENPQADIFQFNGIVYINASDVDWVMEQELKKGELVGEIKKVSSSFFKDGTASILPVGTKLYNTKNLNGDIIIAEYKDKLIPYLGLYEG